MYKITDQPGRKLAKYLVDLEATRAFAKARGEDKRAQEIDDWFARFEAMLQTVFDAPSLKLDFNINTFQFTFHMENREPFDFHTLARGYAAIFDIIGDLIIRMGTENHYNLEGFVLIDEIETHLHVDLQKKIIPILMQLFPRLQFILTTHSPFILNSVPQSVVYDLETHTFVENGLTNLPYDGIIEGYFHADLLSQELRQKFKKLYQ